MKINNCIALDNNTFVINTNIDYIIHNSEAETVKYEIISPNTESTTIYVRGLNYFSKIIKEWEHPNKIKSL